MAHAPTHTNTYTHSGSRVVHGLHTQTHIHTMVVGYFMDGTFQLILISVNKLLLKSEEFK